MQENKKTVLRGARSLWKTYSEGRAPGDLRAEERRAYAAYYLPSNAPKLALCLAEASWSPPKNRPMRLLDLGAGTGAFTLAARDLATERGGPLEAFSVDRDGGGLRDLERFFGKKAGHRLTALALDITNASLFSRLGDGLFDLIVLGNSLGEAFPDDDPAAAAFLGRLLAERLDPGGLLLVVEPALRVSARRLHRVRDILAEEGVFPKSPCLYRGPCPALMRERDWCHEERPWRPPEEVRLLAERLGHVRDALKYSFLCYAKGVGEPLAPRLWRVVSSPLPGKGKREFFLCGSGGRRRFSLLKRDERPGNEEFAGARRGDVWRVEGFEERKNEARLGADSLVSPVRRAPRTEDV